MVQSASKVLTVDEFISHYGECDRNELIDGELIEIEATEPHEAEIIIRLLQSIYSLRARMQKGLVSGILEYTTTFK